MKLFDSILYISISLSINERVIKTLTVSLNVRELADSKKKNEENLHTRPKLFEVWRKKCNAAMHVLLYVCVCVCVWQNKRKMKLQLGKNCQPLCLVTVSAIKMRTHTGRAKALTNS